MDLTVTIWNGKPHFAKANYKPRCNSMMLGREVERHALTFAEGELSIAALQSLHSFGVLNSQSDIARREINTEGRE